MDVESLENDGDIEAGLINEKETVCNKSAPNSVFGGSSIHLKKENVIIGWEKPFMRLAWLCQKKN